jgi:FkbM family methyltransferase
VTPAEHINSLDEMIRPYLRPDFFFVNVGASDGVTNDPIYPFIERYGWHGLAIEPVPPVFEQLTRNYAHLADLVELVHAAVSESDQPIWYVDHPERLEGPFHITQISSLNRQRVEQTLRQLGTFDQAVTVTDDLPIDDPTRLTSHRGRCVSFNDLMTEHDVQRIDFLNIDVEGLDLDVLTSIDFDRFGPTLLCLEVTPMNPDERTRARRLLRDEGYEKLMRFDTFSEVFARPG